MSTRIINLFKLIQIKRRTKRNKVIHFTHLFHLNKINLKDMTTEDIGKMLTGIHIQEKLL